MPCFHQGITRPWSPMSSYLPTHIYLCYGSKFNALIPFPPVVHWNSAGAPLGAGSRLTLAAHPTVGTTPGAGVEGLQETEVRCKQTINGNQGREHHSQGQPWAPATGIPSSPIQGSKKASLRWCLQLGKSRRQKEKQKDFYRGFGVAEEWRCKRH